MKTYLSFSAVILALLVQSCGSDKPKAFRWSVSPNQQTAKIGDSINFKLNTFDNTFDSLIVTSETNTYRFKSSSQHISWPTNKEKLGSSSAKFELYANGRKYTKSTTYYITPKESPKQYTYNVLNTYPHNNKSFTQGLEFEDNNLYESTGQRGHSTLEKIDLKTGESLQKHELSDDKFGEGLTIIDNKMYQLTWQGGMGYIYNLDDFALQGTFPYGQSREGWGLCNDGEYLYKSDGSDRIYKLDPKTFKEISSVQVTSDKFIYKLINELEWVDGKIYANVYFKDEILIINPETGQVDGIIDLSNIMYPPDNKREREEVLNGIAYNGVKNELYITGKHWPKLFHIKLIEK